MFLSLPLPPGISIKRAAGRLEAPDDFLDAVAANEFVTLAISAEHPWLPGGCHLVTPIPSTGCC
jgi:hypothetical protein